MTTRDDAGEKARPTALPAAIAAGTGALFGARLGPDGAVVGAFFGPYLEILLRRSFAEFGADANERVRRMMGSARDTAECTDLELEERLLQSEWTRLLNVTAINAAAGTAWPPKVVALGRVLAAGLIASDEAKIDLAAAAMTAMADMERPHVVLLELLVRQLPARSAAGPLQPVPAGDYDYPQDYPVPQPIWTTEQITAVRPQLSPAFDSVAGILQQHGLIVHTDRAREALEQIGKEFEEQVNRHAARNDPFRTARVQPLTVQAPRVREIERSWAATELGRRVLAYYGEAAAADRELT